MTYEQLQTESKGMYLKHPVFPYLHRAKAVDSGLQPWVNSFWNILNKLGKLNDLDVSAYFA